jgi:hypothetical protein
MPKLPQSTFATEPYHDLAGTSCRIAVVNPVENERRMR